MLLPDVSRSGPEIRRALLRAPPGQHIFCGRCGACAGPDSSPDRMQHDCRHLDLLLVARNALGTLDRIVQAEEIRQFRGRIVRQRLCFLVSWPRNSQAVLQGCDLPCCVQHGVTAMAAPEAVRVELSESERAELQARLRRRKVSRGDALRAEIVLLAAEGLSNLAITERLGVARMTVATWRGRFAEQRLERGWLTNLGRARHERSAAHAAEACRAG
jgi:Homeodomain-like domain-containing protein